MEALERVLSRPTAKPYRSRKVLDEGITLNKDGLLDFSPNDIENPKNWSVVRRWYITVVAISLVVNSTFASSSPSGCVESIASSFGVSQVASNLVTTLFLLGYCFGPLLWGPLCELYGRRYVFYGTFICYIAFNFLCAFTKTFAGLLVGRLLTGTFASAALSNCPGVLADIWGPIERGNAMVVFSMMTFAGPALGPVVSGFLQVTKDWRWTFYVLLWMGAGTLALMLTLPETFGPVVLTNKARRIRRAKVSGFENVRSPAEASEQTPKDVFRITLTRPWIILFDPISFLIAIYLSIVYALLYMLFTIYPIVFQQMRGWNAGVGALPLIGTICGAFLAGVIVFYESTLGKKKMLAGIERTPEDRMPLAMIGGVLFPICMFWFGWAGNYNAVPWIVPTLAGVFLSTGIVLIFVSYLNYLTDTYLMYAASASAANTICRSVFGAVAPLFTAQMFHALGVGPAASLIGGVGCLLAPIPFLFYKYGKGIREKSKFAPTDHGRPTATQENANDGSSSSEEADMDEEAEVVDKDLEKAISNSSRHASRAKAADGNADGLEKAERH
ncbi:hypothetical protein AC578_4537 [Pseudocercospora eumusae]|uniref:Cercosporin MFS transporter CTB4 n=1 Tax=Pseudocercospora eumusae TaxID=321146 RepID=A0A139HG86_9PEZI|nr:hypothetical protein AC578_4537 [Pseudocercospora eumusae]